MPSAPKLDISPNDLKIVLDILERHVPDREVWAFGSRATWKTKDYSDLDLAVIGDTPLPLAVSAALSDDFAESDLPFKVDVVDWATTSETFRGIIERDRVILKYASNWSKKHLGDAVSIKHGYAFSGDFFSETPNDIILLTPGNFAIGGGFSARKFKYYTGEIPQEYILRPGDLLVSMTDLSKNGDTLGYPALVPDDGKIYLHNQRLGLVQLRNNKQFSKNFIYWLLRTNDYRNEILATATGSTVRHTAPSRICAHQFCAPSLAEQERIASVLDALDKKIEINNHMNESLEAMGRAIFNSWFVDFEHVRKGIESWQREGCDVASRGGWTQGTLNDLLSHGSQLITPAAQSDVLFAHHSIPAFDAGEVPNMEMGKDIKSNKFIIPEDAVLLSKLNPSTQRVWLVDDSRYQMAICSTEFLAFTPKPGIPRSFIYFLLKSEAVLERLAAMASGTSNSHQRVRPADVLSVPTTVPASGPLNAFDAAVTPLLDKVLLNRRQTCTLAQLRDALLPKLLSGELRIPDAEKAIEAVA